MKQGLARIVAAAADEEVTAEIAAAGAVAGEAMVAAVEEAAVDTNGCRRAEEHRRAVAAGCSSVIVKCADKFRFCSEISLKQDSVSTGPESSLAGSIPSLHSADWTEIQLKSI